METQQIATHPDQTQFNGTDNPVLQNRLSQVRALPPLPAKCLMLRKFIRSTLFFPRRFDTFRTQV